jgi:hypothetical protein
VLGVLWLLVERGRFRGPPTLTDGQERTSVSAGGAETEKKQVT